MHQIPEPYYMSQTLPHNREKVFARSLNKIISELWRNEFLEEFQDPPVTRKDAYIIIAGQDLNRENLFQAARTLEQSYTLEWAIFSGHTINLLDLWLFLYR